MIIFDSEKMIKNSIFLFIGLIIIFSIIIKLFTIDYSQRIDGFEKERSAAIQSLNTRIDVVNEQSKINGSELSEKADGVCPSGYEYKEGICKVISNNKNSVTEQIVENKDSGIEQNQMPVSALDGAFKNTQKQILSTMLSYSGYLSIILLIFGFFSFMRSHEIYHIIMPIGMAVSIQFLPIMLNTIFKIN